MMSIRKKTKITHEIFHSHWRITCSLCEKKRKERKRFNLYEISFYMTIHITDENMKLKIVLRREIYRYNQGR